jgi:hypothetical protein
MRLAFREICKLYSMISNYLQTKAILLANVAMDCVCRLGLAFRKIRKLQSMISNCLQIKAVLRVKITGDYAYSRDSLSSVISPVTCTTVD